MERARYSPTRTNSPGVNAAELASKFGPAAGMDAIGALTELSLQVRDRAVNRMEIEAKKTEEAVALEKANSFANANRAIDQRIAEQRTFIETGDPEEVSNVNRKEFHENNTSFAVGRFESIPDSPQKTRAMSRYFVQAEALNRALDAQQDQFRDRTGVNNLKADNDTYVNSIDHTVGDFANSIVTAEGLLSTIKGNLLELNGQVLSSGEELLSDPAMLSRLAARTSEAYSSLVSHSIGAEFVTEYQLRVMFTKRFGKEGGSSSYPFISMGEEGVPLLEGGVAEDVAPEEIWGAEADDRMHDLFHKEFTRRNMIASFVERNEPDHTIMEEAWKIADAEPSEVVLPDNFLDVDRDTLQYQTVFGIMETGRIGGFDAIEGSWDEAVTGQLDLIATEKTDEWGRTIIEAYHHNPETGKSEFYGNFFIRKDEAHPLGNSPLAASGSKLPSGQPAFSRNPGTAHLLVGKPNKRDLVNLVLNKPWAYNPKPGPSYEQFLQAQNDGAGAPASKAMERTWKAWSTRIEDVHRTTANRTLARSSTPRQVAALFRMIDRELGDSPQGRRAKDELAKAREELQQDIAEFGIEHWIDSEPHIFKDMDKDTRLVAASQLTNRILGGGMDIRLPSHLLRKVEAMELGDKQDKPAKITSLFRRIRNEWELANPKMLDPLYASLEKELVIPGMRFHAHTSQELLEAKLFSDEWGAQSDEVDNAMAILGKQLRTAVADGRAPIESLSNEVANMAGFLVARRGLNGEQAVQQSFDLLLGPDKELIEHFGGHGAFGTWVAGRHSTGETSFIASKQAKANYASTIKDPNGYNNAVRKFLTSPALLAVRTKMDDTDAEEERPLMIMAEPYILEIEPGKLVIRFYTKNGQSMSPFVVDIDGVSTLVELDFGEFVSYHDYYDVGKEIPSSEYGAGTLKYPPRPLIPALRSGSPK